MYRLLLLLFAFSLLTLASCDDNTDVRELYEQMAAPVAVHSDEPFRPLSVSATSAVVHREFENSQKVCGLLCYVSTDTIELKARTCRRFMVDYQPTGGSSVALLIDSLMPNTRYHYFIETIDGGGILRPGFSGAFNTYNFRYSYAPEYPSWMGITIHFEELGPNSLFGYELSYDPSFATSTRMTKYTNTPNQVSGKKSSVTLQLDTVMPRQTFYYRTFVENGGHTFRGETRQETSQFFDLSTNFSKTGSTGFDVQLIVFRRFDDTTDAEVLSRYDYGFYLSDHPVTPSDFGERYELKGGEKEAHIEGLKPGTKYYVRPFISRLGMLTLFDEAVCSTRNGL